MTSGALSMTGDPEAPSRTDERDRLQKDVDEPHLRSVEEVTGYHIHATDGEIGHLSDLIVQDTDWSIRFLIVDTSNWWMGQKVLISPRSAREIRWAERLIDLDVDRQKIMGSPPYDPDHPIDRAYADRMAAHFATPRSEPDGTAADSSTK